MSYNQTRLFKDMFDKGRVHGERDADHYTWNLSLNRSGLQADTPEWAEYVRGYQVGHQSAKPIVTEE